MNGNNRQKELGMFLQTKRKQLPLNVLDNIVISKKRRAQYPLAEEIAEMINISSGYYKSMEHGKVPDISEDILFSISKTFRLTEGERAYLFYLAGKSIEPNFIKPDCLIPHLFPLVEGQPFPSLLLDESWDILTQNKLCAKVFYDISSLPQDRRNVLLIMLLESSFKNAIKNWESYMKELVATFRVFHTWRTTLKPWIDSATGKSYISRVTDIFNELKEKCPEFENWWKHPYGTAKSTLDEELMHPVVGRLAMYRVVFTLHEYPLLVLVTYVPKDSETMAKIENLR